MLTATEARLAAILLKIARDVFANRCCNDFNLRTDAKMEDPAEWEALHRAYARFNGEDVEQIERDFPDDLRGEWMQDAALMGFLAARLRGEIDAEGRKVIPV